MILSSARGGNMVAAPQTVPSVDLNKYMDTMDTGTLSIYRVIDKNRYILLIVDGRLDLLC